MRIPLLVLWLLIPLGAWAYHEGPGQDRLAVDRAGSHIADGHAAAEKGQYKLALKHFEAAAKVLPKERVAEARWLRLEIDKAKLEAEKLPEAHADLKSLVEELTGAIAKGEDVDAALLSGAREALASSQYYMTWLMRLEGRPREDWEPEIEASRQNYRLLAELSADDPAVAMRFQKDVESAVRLARMDLGELQGLPLPSQ